MSEMVDKVTRALLTSLVGTASQHGFDVETRHGPLVGYEGDIDLRELARAALDAMQAPPEALLARFGAGGDSRAWTEFMWRAMIDAVLERAVT